MNSKCSFCEKEAWSELNGSTYCYDCNKELIDNTIIRIKLIKDMESGV